MRRWYNAEYLVSIIYIVLHVKRSHYHRFQQINNLNKQKPNMIILLSTRVEQIKSTLLQKKETKHLVSTENLDANLKHQIMQKRFLRQLSQTFL